ncbi:MAG: hypothetical protein AB7N76_36005 [Planctomycetota bacterium]
MARRPARLSGECRPPVVAALRTALAEVDLGCKLATARLVEDPFPGAVRGALVAAAAGTDNVDR